MEPFQAVGLALVVAAIVVGGLEAAGFKIGVVESRPRQLMLAGLGAAVFVFGTPEVWSWARPAPPPMMSVVSSVNAAQPAPPTMTLMASPTPAPPTATPSASATPEPSATQTAAPTATGATAPAATSGPAATSAPAQAATQAPAARTPVLPGVRKDGDGRR